MTIKIAVCISGFLRTWQQTKSSFQKNFEGIDVDIYAQTYNQNYFEYTGNEKDQLYTDEQIKGFFSGINVVKLLIDDIHIIRKKNKIDSEKYRDIFRFKGENPESSDPNSEIAISGERTFEQLRVIQSTADAMRESGKKYDLVVKTRYDVLYMERPRWHELMDGKIHFDSGACGGYPAEIVVIGTPNVMSPILDRFKLLEFLFYPKINIDENKDYVIAHNCDCKKILPCCEFCSHATFRHLLNYYCIEIGSHSCFIRVLRGRNRMHIPFVGTIDV